MAGGGDHGVYEAARLPARVLHQRWRREARASIAGVSRRVQLPRDQGLGCFEHPLGAYRRPLPRPHRALEGGRLEALRRSRRGPRSTSGACAAQALRGEDACCRLQRSEVRVHRAVPRATQGSEAL
eukprot:10945312-Heterocapsa_arctica.AAC.1